MEMVLKFDSDEFRSTGNIYRGLNSIADGCHVVSINGVEQIFKMVQIDRTPASRERERYFAYEYEYCVTLQSVEKTKSKQELDAEDAVKKAKASLDAAQKVLESVKGV